jgi:cytochrome P450
LTTVSAPGRQARRCPFDPPAEYEAVRDQGQIGEIPLRAGGSARLLTRYRDVTAVLADPRFSSKANEAPPLPDGRPTPAWFFGMDPPEQSRFRKLLAGSCTMRAARAMTPRIERIVADQLEIVRGSGSPVDLVPTFTWVIPKLVMYDLLGVDGAAGAAIDSAIDALDDASLSPESWESAYATLWHVVVALAEHKRQRPGPDLLSDIQAHGQVTAEEAASIAISLRMAGHAPVSHVLGLGLFFLLVEPERRAFLTDAATVGRAVDELLRYLPTNNLGVFRVATEDVPLADQVIPKDSLVFVSLPTANRDTAQFLAPAEPQFDRAAAAHLAFGYGAHKCVGQNLAKVILEVSFGMVMRRFPDLRLAVEPDAVPMIDSHTSYSVASLPVTWRDAPLPAYETQLPPP